jgi:PelA/Pel-15E family pectate lyase
MIPLLALLASMTAQDDPSPEGAAAALRKAAGFFRSEVAIEGGYLWKYSEDLKLREGEGVVHERAVWVQPPGTPAVGMALLGAWEATGDRFYLEAAREAGGALLRGQLRSGGWTYRVDFDPEPRSRAAYRGEPEKARQRNWSTLDDDTTQSALRFLARLDRALDFKDAPVHEAALSGFDALLKAQAPSGGFPQGFEGPAADHPAKKASYPESWPRTQPPRHNYWVFYTLNDNLVQDVVDTLLLAANVYREKKYRDAAERTGSFLILAQMPDPQPAWAQQYDFEMRPVWARKFEPPAVTGGESQGAMETLLRLARVTGDPKYLEPLPRAIDYLRRSLRPDGKLARFYELQTNKPLYFTRTYELTYSDADVPTHYSFTVGSRLDRIAAELERLKAADLIALAAAGEPPSPPRLTKELAAQARTAIAALDTRGRWVDEGPLRYHKGVEGKVIDCATFIRNAGTLSRYLAAAKK